MAAAELWADRADLAEAAIVRRHLRRAWFLPGTMLAVPGSPATPAERRLKTWHYWWQAHLIEVAIDAAVREPSRQRTLRVRTLLRTHRLRNGWSVTNQYYDDMAWLALALERADRELGINTERARKTLAREFVDAWVPDLGGGIPWRKPDLFFNTPANAPAAIFLARNGNRDRAVAMADWIQAELVDRGGLIYDGKDADGTLHREFYTYCQGVVIGLEIELARTAPDPGARARHTQRARSVIDAAARELLTQGGFVRSGGGGDGGLFHGILIRYLALAATELGDAAGPARDIVLASAAAAWDTIAMVDSLPLFSADWTRRAEVPTSDDGGGTSVGGAVNPSRVPERDLSVQLSGWMTMEAAARNT